MGVSAALKEHGYAVPVNMLLSNASISEIICNIMTNNSEESGFTTKNQTGTALYREIEISVSSGTI